MQITIINEQQKIRSTNGVYYHRLFTPHNYLSKHFDVNVTITDNFTTLPRELKKKTDIAIFNGHLPFYTLPHLEVEEIRKYAKAIVMDIDDVWYNYKGHALEQVKKSKMSFRYPKTYTEHIDELIGLVDVVTTPSKVIKEYVENNFKTPCELLHNAIDTSIEQYKVSPRKYDGVVWFGYLTNAMHYEDAKILVEPLKELYNIYGDRFGVVMTGYNHKGQHQREMAKMMSLNGKIKNFKLIDYVDFDKYAGLLNLWDVSLVPLKLTSFNKGKSILKVVESGLMETPVIVSSVSPYLGNIDDYWLVHSSKDWVDAMGHYIEFPSEIKSDGKDLYNEMSEYKMENQIDKRLNLYSKLLDNV